MHDVGTSDQRRSLTSLVLLVAALAIVLGALHVAAERRFALLAGHGPGAYFLAAASSGFGRMVSAAYPR